MTVDNVASLLTLHHTVRLFGSSVRVSSFARSLLSCFDEMQWRLLRLLQAGTTEEESLATAQRLAEEVRHFLVFLLAYVREVLPSLPALERSVMVHVLETSLMATAQRLLSLRLPVYDVHCRSGRGVYCAALYAHLMTHSALVQLHSILLTHTSSLPHVSSVRLPSSSSPIALPAVCSRWPFRAYAFCLLAELLRLHLCHVAVGSVPFAVYHALPSIEEPHAQAPCAEMEQLVVRQPVLALWRALMAYTDHLHDRQHREAPHPQRWSEELGFLFCSEADTAEQRSLLDRFDDIQTAPSLASELDGLAGDDTPMGEDIDVCDTFPCFYSLLNLALDTFFLQPTLCSPSPSAPLLSIPVPTFSRAELIADCIQRAPGSPASVARGMCDRVETVWELLMDVILPCYSLPPLYPVSPPSSDAVMALCSSYSLYDEPSPPHNLRLELYRRMASPQCACRPHWSLLYFLLRVGMAQVSAEWRAEYSKCTLGRVCAIVHVWPAVHMEPLILQLHALCGLDADPLTSPASAPRLTQGLTTLQHYPAFLFADPVHVTVHSLGDESAWCRYLRLLHAFLRMVAEAQLPFGCNVERQPLLSHNNFAHHSLLFASHTANLHVISSLYHLFPSPPSMLLCSSSSHAALDAALQLASLYLLASLVSDAECRTAHIHLEKLIDWRQSRCFHAHSLLLLCCSSLLSLRIERGMDTGEAIQRFNDVLRHLVQQLMDEEEDIEALQCQVWAPPREWTEEQRRTKVAELQSLRLQLEDRRKRVVDSFALLRRLLAKRREWSGHLGGDCALLVGELVGLPLSQSFNLESPSSVLDLLRPDRPVVLPLRQHALRIVELVVRSRCAVSEAAVDALGVGEEEKAEGGSQDSDEVEREVRAVEQRRAEEERLRYWPSFLRFLSTAHRILLDNIRAATDPAHQSSALLLLNPHRAELVSRFTLDSGEMERYRKRKKDHRATKAQFRRQGTRSLDDHYRVDKAALMSCIALYADISHVLLAHPDRLTVLRVVADFGVVRGEESSDGVVCWQRYLPLFMWDAFLSSQVIDARQAIDRALSSEADRCALLAGLFSVLLDPITWQSEATSLPLPSLLSSTLSHPAFRRYQQPLVDTASQCATMLQLLEHRADIFERLLRGIGLRYQLSVSQPSLHRSELELHRGLLPPLLAQLSSHHDRLVQRSVSGRAEPDRSPPILDAADLDYIRFLYRVLTSIWQHCLPLLHPRHAKDPTPVDSALSCFYDKVVPMEAPSSSSSLSSSFSVRLHLPTAELHQEAALASWPHLLRAVHRLGLDPRQWLPAEGDASSAPLSVSMRALIGTIKRFWPVQVGVQPTRLSPHTPPAACCSSSAHARPPVCVLCVQAYPDPVLPASSQSPTPLAQVQCWRQLRAIIVAGPLPHPPAAFSAPAAHSSAVHSSNASARASRPSPMLPSMPLSQPSHAAARAPPRLAPSINPPPQPARPHLTTSTSPFSQPNPAVRSVKAETGRAAAVKPELSSFPRSSPPLSSPTPIGSLPHSTPPSPLTIATPVPALLNPRRLHTHLPVMLDGTAHKDTADADQRMGQGNKENQRR